MGFQAKLEQGKAAETKIANWLRFRCGYSILPVYEIAEGQYKGPQVYTASGSLVAPDLFAFRHGSVKWIEAKQKSVFSWYRKGLCWQTGIDQHHYRDYLRIALESPWPVWLLFYHTKDSSPEGNGKPPTGLFGNDLIVLQDLIDHPSDRWGRHGMVYWNHSSLKLLATREQVEAAQPKTASAQPQQQQRRASPSTPDASSPYSP